MKEIEKRIGSWGRYQAFIYALLFFPSAITGCHALIFTFTGGIPKTRCKLKSIDGDDAIYESQGLFKLNFSHFYPETEAKTICYYCPDAVEASKSNASDYFDQFNATCQWDETLPCDYGNVYDHSQFRTSMAIEYEMVCEDGAWKHAFVKSMIMLGFLIGAVVFGSLSDRFGRRPILLFCIFSFIITLNIVPILPTNFPLLCAMNVLNGGLTYGAFLISFVIVMELIKGFARTVAGVWVQGFFTAGIIYGGVLAYFIRDWRYLHWACFAPSVLLVLYYLLIMIPVVDPSCYTCIHDPDLKSDHDHYLRGRRDEAHDVILNAAKWNRILIPQHMLEKDLVIKVVEKYPEKANVFDLFRNGFALARNTLVIFYTWFAVALCYYGLSLNTNLLPGNEYLNFLLLAIIEAPAYLICIPMMEYWGRKPTMCSLMIAGGISCMISAFLPPSRTGLVITFAMIGKLCISAVFAVIYNYSAEFFPTVVRNAGTGFSSLCGKIGSVLAPQVTLLRTYGQAWLPMFVFGCVAVVAGLCDFYLPETKGKPLPDTLRDGISFSAKRGSWIRRRSSASQPIPAELSLLTTYQNAPTLRIDETDRE